MAQEPYDPRRGPLFLMCAMLLAAMAAGMGWGIRGQYGHETGAMIAGALTSLTLVMLFVPRASSLNAARAAAMMTAAIGIGGSMTYGQTVGLTHDAEVIGNWEALRWGLLGLFVKGAIWIGFAGTFLGMGLGGKRYHPVEMAVLLPALLGLMFFGAWLINSPFDPSTKALPWIYFSDDWYFEPGRELKPRPEVWGGLFVALLSLVVYVRLVRRDRLAGRMALVGMLGGGVGFAVGQCVQAFPRWNPEVFSNGALSAYSEYFRHFNWWNMMETTFGLIFGATLALGLWINRRLIAVDDVPDEVFISPPWEVLLVVTHVVLLLSSEFLNLSGYTAHLRVYTAFGLLMTTLPMVGIVGGRFWPYLMLLPIVAAPIVGKTLRNLTYENGEVSVADSWLLIVQVPMAIMLAAAAWLICRGIKRQSARLFAAIGLLLTTMLYFGLNTAFFRYAWPWEEWTGRTPNQIIFSVCAFALVVASAVCAATELVEWKRSTVAMKLVLALVACLLPISLAMAQPADQDTATGHEANDNLIKSITKETLFRNRDGSGITWFHPRACMVPGANGRPTALMNLQEIGGSDYFGQVHWSESNDLGRTWSKPEPIAALGRDPVDGHPGLQAGVCDVTPQYHPPTRTVLALGHVVFYRGPRFASGDQLARYPVYVVRRRDGSWSRRKILKWDDPRGGYIYSNNCGQRVVMTGGDIMMSFTFGAEADNRMVAGVRCSFDGEELRIIDVGPPLENNVGRGLLEPSVTVFKDRFYLTMRAEDGHGYVAVSDDGLDYRRQTAWAWDDGESIGMSTTQQHWLTHSEGLFLVYTRQDEANANVIRWRSPLWVARVDTERLCLVRESEKVVLPLVGDGVNRPDDVALMGNFHVTNVTPHESWITVGEWLPRGDARGDLLMSRISWSVPNSLVLNLNSRTDW